MCMCMHRCNNTFVSVCIFVRACKYACVYDCNHVCAGCAIVSDLGQEIGKLCSNIPQRSEYDNTETIIILNQM